MLTYVIAAASAGTLGLSAAAPALLYVDGRPVQIAVGETPAWVELAGTGSHIVEARTSSDRPITSLELVVPDGFEVVVEYRDRHFALTNLASVAPRATLNALGLPGASVTVSAHGTSVTLGGASVVVGPIPSSPVALPVAAPPPASLAPVPVEFRSIDGEWADLYVDGEKIAEFRVNSPPATVRLTPGAHKVEVRDFMGNETWDAGHLMVVGGGTIKVGFGEKSGVEVYNLPQAWTE